MKTTLALLLALLIPFSAFASESEGGAKEGEGPKVLYLDLVPALVGNYGAGPKLKYFKADISLRVTGEDAKKSVEYHEPLIRNQLVMLFAQQTDESLSSVEGKEALRQEALKQVQQALNQEEGKPLVEDLLFNNLIVQP
ncbi:flagellar basal body-associated protein FliL [Metapseudomonas otitidis]|uniref:flagellar basal body-associated protein FliL n=1 Tax=Metapseudomonas otitidis TaxID=319939 RepID=UPI000D1B4279|nr:flagellar basal body-associated protein FliL [Pseudomonas otitidis]MBO2926336.1 flagellar basal body-associated protein FliL [Pseudomonas otitidis]QZX83367.1 flagellar basal body-associated protein FliL [Pseudomonas otitidis]WIF67787.1 flagellar basal body-associated protein FliL [Pseudomonas otitidis]